jgi:PhnB protein
LQNKSKKGLLDIASAPAPCPFATFYLPSETRDFPKSHLVPGVAEGRQRDMATNPIPREYHSVTPFISIANVPQFIDFAKRAFGAQERSRIEKPDGSVMHAEIKIGDSIIMLGDSIPGQPTSTATLYLYVENADLVYESAINAGATSIERPRDMFYGDHAGGVKDPGGNQWWIATHIEDVGDEELNRRAAEWSAKHE